MTRGGILLPVTGRYTCQIHEKPSERTKPLIGHIFGEMENEVETAQRVAAKG